MRFLILIMLISLFVYVTCKTGKTLDTMGQDIIEIQGPKELPPGLEEEPSADLDDSDEDDPRSSTGTSAGVTTKKDTKKSFTTTDARKKLKDVEKIDGLTAEDEEARLEKELAEIYKDTDYKDTFEETTESKETTLSTASDTTITTDDTEKPIGRQRNSFKFAPDSTDKRDVEKFRTSVDDINCKNRKLSATFTKSPSSAEVSKAFYIFNIFSSVFMYVICY